MDNFENIDLVVLGAPVVLAFSNWALSLFLARKIENNFFVDLKQLWPDSLPFLKSQWPIVTIAIIAATLSQLQPATDLTDKPEVALQVFLSVFGSSGILWVLNLFYASYLAAPKYPGRVATIGAWSLVMYIIADMAIVVFGVGLPTLAIVASYGYPDLVTHFMAADTRDSIKNCLPLDVVVTASAQVLSLVIGGLLYKLYERLADNGAAKIVSSTQGK